MTYLGRAFGLSPKLTSLLAIRSSICVVFAIIGAKGAIDADDEDSSYAIAAILALGAFSLFAFPAIGHAAERNVLLVRLQRAGVPGKAVATLHTISAGLKDSASLEHPDAIAPVSRALSYAKDITVELDPYTVAVVEIRAE